MSSEIVFVSCPSGSMAIGGGTTLFPDDYTLTTSEPYLPGAPRPHAWRMVYEYGGSPQIEGGTHFAICLQLPT